MQAFFGGDPQASFFGHRDEIAKVSKLHERYLRSIALSLQSLFQTCQPAANHGLARTRVGTGGNKSMGTRYSLERGSRRKRCKGVPPMGMKRVIDGVHVVP